MPWGALISFSSEGGIMKGICAALGLRAVSKIDEAHLSCLPIGLLSCCTCAILFALPASEQKSVDLGNGRSRTFQESLRP